MVWLQWFCLTEDSGSHNRVEYVKNVVGVRAMRCGGRERDASLRELLVPSTTLYMGPRGVFFLSSLSASLPASTMGEAGCGCGGPL